MAALAFGLLPISPATAAIADICPGPGQTDAFTDDEGSVHENNINCAEAYGIVNGKSATIYDPQGELTRGQAASILVQFAEVSRDSELPAGTDEFPDDEDSVHEANINKAAAANFLEGFNDGTFRPGISITRAQFATIAVQTVEFLLGEDLDSDGVNDFDDDDGSVHELNIEKAVDNDILVGTGPRMFSPLANVTRGQTASIIVGAAGNVLFPAGKFAPANDNANDTLNVSPAADQSKACILGIDNTTPADDVTVTVTGLTAGEPYRLTLVNADNVDEDSSGQTTFEEDTASPGLVAAGTVASKIVSVNGTAQATPAQTFGSVQPVNGTITFVIDCGAAESIVPVVYEDSEDANTRLNIDDDGRPTEEFGTGGTITFTAPTTNQTFAVPQDRQVLEVGTTRTCIVGGITPGSVVDVALVNSSAITTTNGVISFADTDGVGGAGNNQADITESGARIVNVNGTNTASVQRLDDVVATIGTISVTFGGAAGSDVTVVVFADPRTTDTVAGNNQLDLNAANQPTELFGAGCRTLFVPAAAAFGMSVQNVVTVDAASDLFVGGNQTADPTDDRTFRFDANDTFQLQGVGITQAQFEAILSAGDLVTVNFNPDAAGVSIFNITTDSGNAAPAAPTAAAVNLDGEATINDVTVTFTVPAGTNPGTTFTLQQATAAVGVNGVCGGGDDVVGTFTTVPATSTTSANGTRTFTVMDQPNGCFVFRVVSTNPASGVASPSDNSDSVAVPGTAASNPAPLAIDTVVTANAGLLGTFDTGDVFKIGFNEALAVPTAGDIIRATDGDGTVADFVNGTNAAFTLNAAAETVNGASRPANTVLTVTLTASPTVVTAGGTVGLQIPATITDQSGTTDAAGASFSVTNGGQDLLIDQDAADSTTGVAPVTATNNMTSAVATGGTNNLTVTFGAPVQCASVATTDFTFTETDGTVFTPTSVACTGTDDATLVFLFPGTAFTNETGNVVVTGSAVNNAAGTPQTTSTIGFTTTPAV